MRGVEPDAGGGSRGQTSLDFLVGMSVFFIAVAFVLGFLPSIFAPFGGDAGSDLLVADRTAARLSEGMLGAAATPSVLNATCTVEFFDADGAVGDCAYATDADDLQQALGVAASTRVNVSIEEAGTPVTLDGQTLTAGDTPPATVNVVRAQRVVLIDGDERRLVVRVW